MVFQTFTIKHLFQRYELVLGLKRIIPFWGASKDVEPIQIPITLEPVVLPVKLEAVSLPVNLEPVDLPIGNELEP